MHLDHCRWIFLYEFETVTWSYVSLSHVSLFFHILCSVAIVVRHTWQNRSHSLSYWPWRVQIAVILLSDWAIVAITHFHQAPRSGLWCLIHGQSYPYERTIRGTERHHGIVVSGSCRGGKSVAVETRKPCFPAKKYAILHIMSRVFILRGLWNTLGIRISQYCWQILRAYVEYLSSSLSVSFNVIFLGYVQSGANFEVNTLCLKAKVKDWVCRIARVFCWFNGVFV